MGLHSTGEMELMCAQIVLAVDGKHAGTCSHRVDQSLWGEWLTTEISTTRNITDGTVLLETTLRIAKRIFCRRFARFQINCRQSFMRIWSTKRVFVHETNSSFPQRSPISNNFFGHGLQNGRRKCGTLHIKLHSTSWYQREHDWIRHHSSPVCCFSTVWYLCVVFGPRYFIMAKPRRLHSHVTRSKD